MPVAAAIVAVAYGATVFTHLFVASKDSSAALRNFTQHLLLKRGEFCLGNQSGTEPVYHIGQFILWPHFL
jgi:hypothetical protein